MPDLSRTECDAAQRRIPVAAEALETRRQSDSSAHDLASAAEPPLPALDGYALIDRLGRGGMGVVYEAYQLSTGRRVAIKFMYDAGRDTESARRRFEREVELAARLTHPNIVAPLDSGIHSGRYYYVMDYVEGRTLGECATEKRDDSSGSASQRTDDLVRLFATVCDVVDFAHQRGVLHRDLKPSNILVDERGEPHLLDFGLAKAINPESGQWRDLTLSEPGQIIGTLGYMSPEQARGDVRQIGMRSDVYSLGAILYELLSGRLPCPIDGPLTDVLARIVANDPPSLARSIARQPQALDAVVQKALAKEPARRYATAGDLAAELRRYLNDEPVHARPEGAVSRAARWVRRRRAIAAVTAAALLVLTVGGVLSIVRITRESARALANEKLAREKLRFALKAVDRVVFDTDLTLKDVLGTAEVRRSLIDVALGLYESLPRDAALLGLEELTGPQYGKLGDALLRREDTERARQFYQLSLESARSATAAAPDSLRRRRDFAMALERVAILNPNAEEQTRQLHESLAILRSLAEAQPADYDAQRDLADVLMRIAEHDAQVDDGRTSAARAGESIQLMQDRLTTEPTSRPVILEWLTLHRRRAALKSPDNQAVVAACEEAIAAGRRIAETFPDDLDLQSEALLLIGRSTGVLLARRELAPAAAALVDARARSDRLTSAYPRDMRLRYAAATAYAYSGNESLAREQWDEAITWYERSNALVVPAFELLPNDILYRERFALNLGAIGGALVRADRESSAAPVYEQFLGVSEPLLAERPEHGYARAYAWHLVGKQARENDPRRASECFRRGLDELSRLAAKRSLNAREAHVRQKLEAAARELSTALPP